MRLPRITTTFHAPLPTPEFQKSSPHLRGVQLNVTRLIRAQLSRTRPIRWRATGRRLSREQVRELVSYAQRTIDVIP